MQYRRSFVAGGTYFFTVNLADRKKDTLVRRIDDLKLAIQSVKEAHPFSVLAMVVLPGHLHAIWRLPPDDSNYPLRWSLIKANFSRMQPKNESIRYSRKIRRERGIWQSRFWEHQIRDENDLARHVDYIHYNPVKHGLVKHPLDWPHSTLRGYVERGMVSADWGASVVDDLDGCGER